MRKLFAILFFASLYLALSGQNAPDWLDTDIRNVQYPKKAFLTGYAESNIEAGETSEKALERAKATAQTALLENIRVTIKSYTHTEIGSLSSNSEYDEYETFMSKTEKSTVAEIVGMSIESWQSPQDNTVYAFAYVSKAKLTAYYQSQISLWLNKVEGALLTADELLKKGYKTKARKQCENITVAFARVAYAQDLITAINEQASDEILQQARGEILRNSLVQTLTDLENNIYIYMECVETMDGEDVEYIAERLPGIIAEKGCGCSFTELEEEADYIININTKMGRCNYASNDFVFCYATATLMIYNSFTHKTTIPKIAEAKGGWTDADKAIEKAFDELADKISEKIIHIITN